MGFEDGEISLDSPTGSYYAGSTIYGKLIFHENNVQEFRGLYVKFKGYCKVHWTTTHTTTVDGERRTHHETHESEEEYVHLKVYLLGGESGEYTLQPGRHELPFQFIIPQNSPSSFEGSKGHIRYELKAVVDRKFKLDHEMSRDITVIAQLDLNADPYCKEPMVFEFNESYCCCCISSGSSETLIKLPTSGFVPGQVVPVEISCNTLGSSVEITEISFRIEKVITYNANRNPAIETEIEKFGKTITGPVTPDSQRNWTCNLDIPDVPVGSLDTCKFIDIQYNLLVKISPDGCHEDSEDSRRIVIGNIPLAAFTDHSQNVTQIITGPVTNQPLSNAPSPYPNTAPYPGNTPYPGGNSPYPEANPPYPSNTPYPGGNLPPGGSLPNPGANPPYPGGNPPGPTSPYPGANPPYPGANPPYLGANPPYPGANPPYPGQNPPYPGPNPPYPVANPPYPAANTSQPPYPGGNSAPGANPPYPTVTPYPPTTQIAPPPQNMAYQTSPNIGLRTGTVGFTVQAPEMPSLPNPPPAVNPYATASAPPE